MANNRMYLVHKATGEKCSFLKYYPSTGWFLTMAGLEEFVGFLAKFDEESKSSTYGDFFRFEYEETTDDA